MLLFSQTECFTDVHYIPVCVAWIYFNNYCMRMTLCFLSKWSSCHLLNSFQVLTEHALKARKICIYAKSSVLSSCTYIVCSSLLEQRIFLMAKPFVQIRPLNRSEQPSMYSVSRATEYFKCDRAWMYNTATAQLELTPAFVSVLCLQRSLDTQAAALCLCITCDSCWQDHQMLLITMKVCLSCRDLLPPCEYKCLYYRDVTLLSRPGFWPKDVVRGQLLLHFLYI